MALGTIKRLGCVIPTTNITWSILANTMSNECKIWYIHQYSQIMHLLWRRSIFEVMHVPIMLQATLAQKYICMKQNKYAHLISDFNFANCQKKCVLWIFYSFYAAVWQPCHVIMKPSMAKYCYGIKTAMLPVQCK